MATQESLRQNEAALARARQDVVDLRAQIAKLEREAVDALTRGDQETADAKNDLLKIGYQALVEAEADVVYYSNAVANDRRTLSRTDNATGSGNQDPTPSSTGTLEQDVATEDNIRMAERARYTWVEDATSPTGYRNLFTGEPGNPNDDQAVDEIVVEARVTEIMKAPSDHRVRVKPLNPSQFYGERGEEETQEEHLLSIIRETNGVIFPYTPSITYGHQVNYSTSAVTHANQDYFFYDNTSAVQFQVSAKFTAQNEREAKYLLAAKHFFQTSSKMRFGDEDEDRGLPPPMLVFSGYGDLMFNNLPIIMTNFTLDLPDDLDYTKVEMLGTENWVPTAVVFQLTFIVQQTPLQQRDFNFDAFASGALLKKRGWI